MLGRGDATNRDAGSSLASGYKMLRVTSPLPCFGKGIELPPRGMEDLVPTRSAARARGVPLLSHPDLSADRTPILVTFC